MDNMDKFLNSLVSVEAFSPSPDNIWKNPKISPFIFQSHFDENIHGGSKGKKFIEESLAMIKQQAGLYNCNSILDLGCGPGVYSLPLAESGFQVTGIDFSKYSIDYAKKESKNRKIKVKYLQKNFFNINMFGDFDMTILLYEIYSTFKKRDRETLLKSIWNALNDSGIFILDVPSEKRYINQNTVKVWNYFSNGEIYIPESHYLFFSIEKYPQKLIFNHSLFVFNSQDMVNCYDWIQCFDIEDIKEELLKNNFMVKEIFSDLSGKEYNDDSNNIALVCQKISAS